MEEEEEEEAREAQRRRQHSGSATIYTDGNCRQNEGKEEREGGERGERE